jgi:hypothetical protein
LWYATSHGAITLYGLFDDFSLINLKQKPIDVEIFYNESFGASFLVVHKQIHEKFDALVIFLMNVKGIHTMDKILKIPNSL